MAGRGSRTSILGSPYSLVADQHSPGSKRGVSKRMLTGKMWKIEVQRNIVRRIKSQRSMKKHIFSEKLKL